MTYAIIEAGGTQLRVEAGRFYDLNRLHVEEDGNVTIDQVLFVSHDGESLVGQPLVEGAMVSGTVMRHLRRSEEHTSELQSQSTISYAVFCLKKKRKSM